MFKRFLTGFLATLLLSGTAAAESNVIEDELLTSRLVAERSAVPGETTRLALDMTIAPGWHTYWKNAGDSGQAVEITWTLPEGVSVGEITWPAPERQAYPPLMNYGYSDRSTLLMDLSVPSDWPAEKPVEVNAGLFWLVCSEVCIPGEGSLSLKVPADGDGTQISDHREIFASAEASQAMPSPYGSAFDIEEGTFRFHLEGSDFADKAFEDAYFFPATWGVIEHAAEQKFVKGSDGLTFTVPISPDADEPFDGEQLEGIVEMTRSSPDGPVRLLMTVNAQRGSIAAATAVATAPASNSGNSNLLLMLVFAFLGGMLLNLMPCVFPVLALKALGIASSAHEGGRERLTHGLAYAAGILTLFALLALALLALKGAGAAVGWGFQLQNPIVVAVLAYVMLLVGLNLSGLFEVSTGFESVGSDAAASGGTRGAFFTGALAAIVATPCSAPFMATAIGAALTMSAPSTIAIFLMLGLGLALPMILLGVFPGIGKLFPKPGTWMVRLKEFLAFPMYATAAWLIWVLGSLAGHDAMFFALIGAVLVAFAAWALVRVRGAASARMKMLGYGSAVAALALVAFTSATLRTETAGTGKTEIAGQIGESYSAARLSELRADGKPVFINMTADWCISCKVNERVALVGPAFETALEENGITYLKGDWTAYDSEITSLLEKFGRAGVPLYALYPREGEPELLPQILTPAMLKERFGAV